MTDDKGHPCLCDGVCKLEVVEIPLPGTHIDPIKRYCKKNEELRQRMGSDMLRAMGLIEDNTQRN